MEVCSECSYRSRGSISYPLPPWQYKEEGGFLKDRRGDEMSPLATAESWDMVEENEKYLVEIPSPINVYFYYRPIIM